MNVVFIASPDVLSASLGEQRRVVPALVGPRLSFSFVLRLDLCRDDRSALAVVVNSVRYRQAARYIFLGFQRHRPPGSQASRYTLAC